MLSKERLIQYTQACIESKPKTVHEFEQIAVNNCIDTALEPSFFNMRLDEDENDNVPVVANDNVPVDNVPVANDLVANDPVANDPIANDLVANDPVDVLVDDLVANDLVDVPVVDLVANDPVDVPVVDPSNLSDTDFLNSFIQVEDESYSISDSEWNDLPVTDAQSIDTIETNNMVDRIYNSVETDSLSRVIEQIEALDAAISGLLQQKRTLMLQLKIEVIKLNKL